MIAVCAICTNGNQPNIAKGHKINSMKVRIQGNSLRLRLSQSEVAKFHESGMVSDCISFGVRPEDMLNYVIERLDVPEMTASFAGNTIRVLVPTESANTWSGASEEIGLEHLLRYGSNNGNSLRILVEKDFKCIANRPGEDESDNFPNPNTTC